MTTRAVWDPSTVSLATLAPTRRQRRSALAIAAAVLVAWGAIAPFGDTHFPPMNGFIPATEAVLVVCDLMIAALLAGQAVTIGSRALVLLAGGFLFDALIIIPHILTFPGAFMPSGLLGAGMQTTAWLFIFWHFALPAAVIGYVCLPREPRALTATMLYVDATVVVGLVVLLTWIAIAYGDDLPPLFVDRRGFAPLATTVTGFDLAMSVLALLALLARRQKSVFDLWLIVAVVALVAELVVTASVMTGRFSLGFYASRFLSMAASVIVLVALLAETIRQDVRLARANLALQLERSRKLTSLDAALGAIVHEVKQPISSIAHHAEAAHIMLGSPAPDLDELRDIAGEIHESSLRANEIFTSIRGLFRNSRGEFQKLDMNDIASGVLRALRAELREYNVIPRMELEADLPPVLGHQGQLQEVIFYLVHNALDAMKEGSSLERTLHVCTERRGGHAVGVSVQDSGPGIEPGQMQRIFDPFFTTKKNGMGMGLAICRMIVERHGGRLSASTDMDSGARFEMTIPVKRDAELDQQLAEPGIAAVSSQLFIRKARHVNDAPATAVPVNDMPNPVTEPDRATVSRSATRARTLSVKRGSSAGQSGRTTF